MLQSRPLSPCTSEDQSKRTAPWFLSIERVYSDVVPFHPRPTPVLDRSQWPRGGKLIMAGTFGTATRLVGHVGWLSGTTFENPQPLCRPVCPTTSSSLQKNLTSTASERGNPTTTTCSRRRSRFGPVRQLHDPFLGRLPRIQPPITCCFMEQLPLGRTGLSDPGSGLER